MKKLLIMAAVLTSASLLAGCGSTTEEAQSETKDDGIIVATGTIETLTDKDTTTTQIKTLIEKRREELKEEAKSGTGNEKELNEKDIELLESVLNAMTKKE